VGGSLGGAGAWERGTGETEPKRKEGNEEGERERETETENRGSDFLKQRIKRALFRKDPRNPSSICLKALCKTVFGHQVSAALVRCGRVVGFHGSLWWVARGDWDGRGP